MYCVTLNRLDEAPEATALCRASEQCHLVEPIRIVIAPKEWSYKMLGQEERSDNAYVGT